MRAELTAGAAVGPYVLDATLGAGAAATVWRARHTGTGELVALKLFHDHHDGAEAEARVLATLDDPHIVGLREVLTTPAGTALVLDHATGGSLEQLLGRRGLLGPGEVATIGIGVAAALEAAHRKGIVHGDVHPGNVLFDEEGSVLLADFGLVGRPGGARGFTAPEVERGTVPSVRSDLWSLGAVCRAALGDLGPTPIVVVLSVALADDPSDRFESAEAMAEALRDAAGPRPVPVAVRTVAPGRLGRPVTASSLTRRFGPRPPVIRRRRRGPGIVVLPALALLAVALGSVLWPLLASGARRGTGPSTPARCPASSPPVTEPGDRLVPGDPDGDGCDTDAVQRGNVLALTVRPGEPPRRFRLGRVGDLFVLGDWDCDGGDTPGLYRPSTGEIVLFGGLDAAGAGAGLGPAAIGHGAARGSPSVLHAPPACDDVVVSERR